MHRKRMETQEKYRRIEGREYQHRVGIIQK